MYKNARSIPLYNFIEIGETGDFSLILNSDQELKDKETFLKNNREEIADTYRDIVDQYNNLMNNGSYKMDNMNKAELYYCEDKLNSLIYLKWMLDFKGVLSEDVLKDIRALCVSYRTEFTEDKINWSISSIKNRISRKQTQLTPAEEKTDTSFDEYFISVCKAYGQKVNKKDTTLSEWCAIVNSVSK